MLNSRKDSPLCIFNVICKYVLNGNIENRFYIQQLPGTIDNVIQSLFKEFYLFF